MAAMAAVAVGAGTAGAGTPKAGTAIPTGSTGSTGSTAQLVSSSGGAAALVLDDQTAWVGPGQPFDLTLRTGSTTVPTSQLGLSVAVYDCLSSVSEFDQSVSSASPSGSELSSTHAPLPVSGLPSVPGGGFELAMPVDVGPQAAPTPAGTFTIDLNPDGECQPPSPSGVYPVRIQLVNLNSLQVIGGFTTHLVYTEPPAGTQRLNLALVLPIRATMEPAPSPTRRQLLDRPSAALDPLSASAAAAITGTVDAIAKHPSVPITLEASPQTVEALDGSSLTRSTVSELTSLVSAPTSDHQLAWSPYAPVNAAGLVTAGLGDELSQQISQGTDVLAPLVRASGAQPAPTGTGGLGAWITNDGLDTAALSQLEGDGYDQVVLPASSVTSSPTNGSAAEPFVLASERGSSMTAVASSVDLAARFAGSPGNPVLAAHQLVAELAQIYYEKPNDDTPRAVVVVAPSTWTDDPAFVDALLGSLDGNPVVEPVTVDQLFASFPTAGCRDGCRLLAGPGGTGLPVTAIRHQRQLVDGFSSAATGDVAGRVETQLGNLVLAGESESLRPAQQSAVLHNAGLAVDAQLGQLTVGGDRTVTLTSTQGTLQVTIVSTAAYPVTATLTLTSDKLLFPNGTTQWSENTRLLPAAQGSAYTNVVPVAVRARTSGVFNVDIVMHSPSFQLQLANGQMIVRSTATSVVGIVLSLGALAVLIVWWVRTSIKRRRRRAEDESDLGAGLPEAG
jgi:hypothetical protein